MEHIHTSTCGSLLSPLDAEINKLSEQLIQLARTIEEKEAANVNLCKTKKKPIKGDTNKLLSTQRQLERLQELHRQIKEGNSGSFTHYQVLKIRAEQNGWIWTPEAALTLNMPCARHEGPGEKAIRTQFGMSLETTKDKRDLDDGDIKWMESAAGTVDRVSVGVDGQRAYNDFIIELAESGFFKRTDVDPEVMLALRRGEVSKELIDRGAIPEEVMARFNDSFLPSKVLGCYGNIYAVFSFGYNLIPQADADQAWSFLSITKCKPRYVLNKDYSVNKMLEASSLAEKLPAETAQAMVAA